LLQQRHIKIAASSFIGLIADLLPIPGETILDRAFHLRYIPGCQQQASGTEKLSSVALFDALPRQAGFGGLVG
jgi:hypothetical protein